MSKAFQIITGFITAVMLAGCTFGKPDVVAFPAPASGPTIKAIAQRGAMQIGPTTQPAFDLSHLNIGPFTVNLYLTVQAPTKGGAYVEVKAYAPVNLSTSQPVVQVSPTLNTAGTIPLWAWIAAIGLAACIVGIGGLVAWGMWERGGRKMLARRDT